MKKITQLMENPMDLIQKPLDFLKIFKFSVHIIWKILLILNHLTSSPSFSQNILQRTFKKNFKHPGSNFSNYRITLLIVLREWRLKNRYIFSIAGEFSACRNVIFIFKPDLQMLNVINKISQENQIKFI